MISQFVGSSPELDSVLTARRLLGILSLSLSVCPSPSPSLEKKRERERKERNSSAQKGTERGTWVAQSVKQPTSAQIMISLSMSSSPVSGSVLTAQSLDPVSDSVSPSL